MRKKDFSLVTILLLHLKSYTDSAIDYVTQVFLIAKMVISKNL